MKIVKKVFMNKRNKQLSVVIPKREFKALDPTIKFGENLFVEINIVRKKKKDKGG